MGEFGISYAVDTASGPLLNGRISAGLRLIRSKAVGCGLVCRSDEAWNFVAFYTAPADADSDLTYARFGVCRDGLFRNIAVSDEPFRLGTTHNRYSLEFFSGQVRGEIRVDDKAYELRTTCVDIPFPGHAGLLRLYGSSLMAGEVVIQETSIPFSRELPASDAAAEDHDVDVFLCHSSADKEPARQIAKSFAARGIRYWLDEEQITFGDRVVERIEDGLRRSRYVVPCISSNLASSGWARAEYGAILNAELGGDSERVVIPLVLDDSDAEYVPPLLRDKKRAFYANQTEFEHFLRFLAR
ncbi:toll/interleukin-1 receptor domain-containing protein [Nonomuraea sp. NPDC050663]|uniref:toll/interleukin-1 receptor domain-containing protein n=1 Tax=Nonomuraea sp. NPDC050663 TaxID=3364370 RepID=UPI0037874305